MTPRRAAVLGSPIAHSRSPLLHRAAYAALGLDWTYDAIEVRSGQLADFLAHCSAPSWVGLSLTMPLKAEVLPLLDEVSPLARLVGAANTVVFGDAGRAGHNTDVGGMRRALSDAAGRSLEPETATVIGGGATARSALAAAGEMGAHEVTVIVRDPAKAGGLVELGGDLGAAVQVLDWTRGAESLGADVVIATVPPGAIDHLVDAVPADAGILLDVAYGEGVSPLVGAWRAAGGAAADGLDLLLWQAVEQVRLFTGAEPPVDAMRASLIGARG